MVVKINLLIVYTGERRIIPIPIIAVRLHKQTLHKTRQTKRVIACTTRVFLSSKIEIF